MSTRAFRRMRHGRWPLAVAALVGMLVFVLFAPKAAAGGWLIAFVFWSGIPLGSLVALMIHALTGGRWGLQLHPLFTRATSALPLASLLAVPLLAVLPAFYPWAADAPHVPADVVHLYLNPVFFIARTLIALVGWNVLAFLIPRLAGPRAVLTAAIGLIFYGFCINLIGLDWILSLEPPFHSTSFGADLAFVQLASAFAWAALLMPAGIPPQTRADLGRLLLATLLGIAYINFIAVLVIWYGDLPGRVFWFVERGWPWTLVAAFAFVCGSVLPIFSLFLKRVRASRRALRIVGGVTLCGIAAFDCYLIGPAFGVLAIAAGALAMFAIGALALAIVPIRRARFLLPRWRSAHVA